MRLYTKHKPTIILKLLHLPLSSYLFIFFLCCFNLFISRHQPFSIISNAIELLLVLTSCVHCTKVTKPISFAWAIRILQTTHIQLLSVARLLTNDVALPHRSIGLHTCEARQLQINDIYHFHSKQTTPTTKIGNIKFLIDISLRDNCKNSLCRL